MDVHWSERCSLSAVLPAALALVCKREELCKMARMILLGTYYGAVIGTAVTFWDANRTTAQLLKGNGTPFQMALQGFLGGVSKTSLYIAQGAVAGSWFASFQILAGRCRRWQIR